MGNRLLPRLEWNYNRRQHNGGDDADNERQRQSHLSEIGNGVFARPVHHQVGLVTCRDSRGADCVGLTSEKLLSCRLAEAAIDIYGPTGYRGTACHESPAPLECFDTEKASSCRTKQ